MDACSNMSIFRFLFLIMGEGCALECRCQKRVSDALVLELQVTVNLGTQLKFFANVVYVLSKVLSQVLIVSF